MIDFIDLKGEEKMKYKMKYNLNESVPCVYKDISGNVVYTGEIPASYIFYTTGNTNTKFFKSRNKDEK